MRYRSGKIQFLFWLAFFSVFVYLWLVAVGLQTFVLPKETPTELPQHETILMFLLFGFSILMNLSGTFVAMMIGNRFYIRFFGAMTMILFASLIFAKSYFG